MVVSVPAHASSMAAPELTRLDTKALRALASAFATDAPADVQRYHRAIEEQVRRAPEQYLWSYKRFRPLPGEADPYRDNRARGSTGDEARPKP